MALRSTEMACSLAVALLFASAAAAGEPIDRLEHWEYRWGDSPRLTVGAFAWLVEDPTGWRPIALPGYPPRESSGQDRVWMRLRLPAGPRRDPALKIDAIAGNFDVFLEGRLVYQFPPGAGFEARGLYGVPWHLIELPPDAGGRLLSVRMTAPYLFAGPMGLPRYGERAELIQAIIKRDLGSVAISCLMAFLGLLALLVLAPQGGSRPGLGFALFAVSAAIYSLTFSQLKDLILPGPLPWLYAWSASINLMPVGFYYFLSELFPERSRRPRLLLRIHLIYAVAIALWTLIGSALLEVCNDAWVRHLWRAGGVINGGQRVLILVSASITGWGFFKEARSGDRDSRILLAGVVAVVASGLRNVLEALTLATFEWPSHFALGLLAFTVAMGLLLQRRHTQTRLAAAESAAELVSRSREKEAMLRDLHDGIGGVTTNIRLLAELGQRSDGKAREALATIAELSSEGLAELRAFVQTLEETTGTWGTLAAELHRYGGQLIESHGQEFRMRTAIGADGVPPGVMSLGLLRIFREALTNVVKHAGATRVEVDFLVSSTEVTLRIDDDGAGTGKGGGLDTGRGLANMKSRARELGGILEIVREAGTRVEVVVPLARISPKPSGKSANTS